MRLVNFSSKKFLLSSGVLTAVLFFTFVTGCKDSELKVKGSLPYIASIAQWHQKRIENLKKENGWLNLVGLYWLSDGENTFGSDTSNKIIFPKDKAPAFIGTFTLKNGKVKAEIRKGLNVTVNGKQVENVILVSDTADNTTALSLGSLRWFLIKRGDKFGIRLRDLNAPLLSEFKNVDTFPTNEDYKVKAKFVKYDIPKVISVPSIIGTTEQDTVEGALKFNLNGSGFKLDPIKEGNEFFIIFADETNGDETYGAGRFLYADEPDSSGNVILDFNKAYNPPCAFTKFATCPLPPEQNYLHTKIFAGEKSYGSGHH